MFEGLLISEVLYQWSENLQSLGRKIHNNRGYKRDRNSQRPGEVTETEEKRKEKDGVYYSGEEENTSLTGKQASVSE